MIRQIFRSFTSVVFVIAIISITTNIVKQFLTIKQAEDKNSSLSEEIIVLDKENKDLSRTIEYATSSAFLERQARITLGMGGENDYWIKNTKDNNIDLYPKVKGGEKESIWIRWTKLFTR